MLTAKAITRRFLLTSCRIHIFAREHVGLHYWDFIGHLPVTAISIQPLLSSQGIQIFSSWPVVLRCLQTSFLVYETNALFKRSYIATKLTTHPNREYINVMWLMVMCLQNPHRLLVAFRLNAGLKLFCIWEAACMIIYTGYTLAASLVWYQVSLNLQSPEKKIFSLTGLLVIGGGTRVLLGLLLKYLTMHSL